MKRNSLGALLCLCLVGEVNVGLRNGLFTPVGCIVLLILYLVYFQLLDALVARFRLSALSLVLVNFSLYSVLITGLLHGEIAEYVLHPQNSLITSLIRIQCSLFPIFVYQLLRRWNISQNRIPPKLSRATLYFLGYIALLSISKTFGVEQLFHSFVTAPVYSTGFLVAAAASLLIAPRLRADGIGQQKIPAVVLYALLAVSVVPLVPAFFLLLILELVASAYYLRQQYSS